MSSLFKNTKGQSVVATTSPTELKPKSQPESVKKPIPLLSDEAKAEAKAAALRTKDAAVVRAQQAGAAAMVAAAGLQTRWAIIRKEPVGRPAKAAMASVVIVAVLACAGIEWHAHRSLSVPANEAVTKAAPQAAVSVSGSPTAVPVTAPPVVARPAAVVSQPEAVPAAELKIVSKPFNPMSPDYKPEASPTIAPAVVAPAPMPPRTSPALKPKSFNPMSPNYKPVVKATAWEKQQDDAMDQFKNRLKAKQGH